MSKWPETLPEKPIGWTKSMSMHLNFGSKGGAASFTVKDQAGREMPIGYQYDTRKGSECNNGFTLPDIEKCMSWPELRKAWPEWLKTHAEVSA